MPIRFGNEVVFSGTLTGGGLEIEPDGERDVRTQIEFPVRVAPDLRPMDPRLFRPDPMRWLAEFRVRTPSRARKLRRP